MITERIKISNDGTGMGGALNIVDSLAVSMNLTKKQFFHLRLLAEEVFNLVRAITGGFDAYFWVTEEDRLCKLHLDVPKIKLDYEKRREFLSVSTNGENSANLGVMDKIRNFVEAGLYSIGEGYNIQAQCGVGMFSYGAVGINDTAMSDAIFAWSMQKYKSEIETRPEELEAQNELERSIIANIADDVRVGVRKDSLRIIIEKKF